VTIHRNVLLGCDSRIRVGNIKLNEATLGASQSNELLFQTKGRCGIRFEPYVSQRSLRTNYSAFPLCRTTFWTRICIHKLHVKRSSRCERSHIELRRRKTQENAQILIPREARKIANGPLGRSNAPNETVHLSGTVERIRPVLTLLGFFNQMEAQLHYVRISLKSWNGPRVCAPSTTRSADEGQTSVDNFHTRSPRHSRCSQSGRQSVLCRLFRQFPKVCAHQS
jgi:hypothetical protein